ncbi:MAG: hypothetical protein KDC44_15160 [Phaeodactylibacter sp.]|nr:hypothetical protein [Phaeodactylibacter sp.]
MLIPGLYNLGIRLYGWGIKLAAFFSPKAKRWLQGRQAQVLPKAEASDRIRWWFHCASLGEFEQARPLIEALKAREEKTYIILSFLSPSGYEIRKNYKGADLVC